MTTMTNTAVTPATSAGAKDATALLRADHAAVSDLFADYEKTRSDAKKNALVAEICTALRVHAQIEEELFYPAVKADLLAARSAGRRHSDVLPR